jgi:membrane protease YdiL (CAAX protease family)
MPDAFRHAIGIAGRRLRRLALRPDPVLLRLRVGRWRWPWAIAGVALTALLVLLLMIAVAEFEELAVARRWVRGAFPQNVYPLDPAQPVTYVDILLFSLALLLPPLVALRVAHGLPWRQAFAFGADFRWDQFRRAALAFASVAMLGLLLGYLLEPQQHRFPARPPGHALWVALALGVVLVQSLAEEVLFRGYLLRVSGAVLPFRLPVTAAVLALFVSLHLGNDDVQRDLVLNTLYFVVGEAVAYGLLFRTRNLAAPAGLHWVNNTMVLLAPAMPGQPTALALMVYTDPVYAAGGSRLLDPLTHASAIAGVALLLALLLWRHSPFHLAAAREEGPPAGRVRP